MSPLFSGFFWSPSPRAAVRADMLVNRIIGVGSSIPANYDDSAETRLAVKLHMPNDVAQNRVGNMGT